MAWACADVGVVVVGGAGEAHGGDAFFGIVETELVEGVKLGFGHGVGEAVEGGPVEDGVVVTGEGRAGRRGVGDG